MSVRHHELADLLHPTHGYSLCKYHIALFTVELK